MQRVDFHVLESSDARARLKFACEVIDRLFAAEQRVLVWFDDAAQLQAFDELLWTFAQDSFIPHDPLGPEANWEDAPVLLGWAAAPPPGADVLVNLASGVPALARDIASVIEIIDADPAGRQAGRARYRQYRELGVEPTTHKLGGQADPADD